MYLKNIIITILFAIIFIFSLVTVSKVYAYPFTEVTGYANPDENTVTVVNDITTLDVDYSFLVTAADFGALMSGVSLAFEADIFTDIHSVSGFSPADWTDIIFTSSSGNRFEYASAGTTLGVGDVLSFTANVSMYTTALTDATNWDEGQVFGQAFSVSDTLHGSDGGITTQVPEPGTISLLGIGLAGLIGAGVRKKMKKYSA